MKVNGRAKTNQSLLQNLSGSHAFLKSPVKNSAGREGKVKSNKKRRNSEGEKARGPHLGPRKTRKEGAEGKKERTREKKRNEGSAGFRGNTDAKKVGSTRALRILSPEKRKKSWPVGDSRKQSRKGNHWPIFSPKSRVLKK